MLSFILCSALFSARADEPETAPKLSDAEKPLPELTELTELTEVKEVNEAEESKDDFETLHEGPKETSPLIQRLALTRTSEAEYELLRKKRAEFYGIFNDALKPARKDDSALAQYSIFQPLTEAEKQQSKRLPLSWRDPIHDDMQGWVFFGVRK